MLLLAKNQNEIIVILINFVDHCQVIHYTCQYNVIVITPRQQAIANGQRSLGPFLLLHLSNTFFRILAVPSNAVFCSNPVLMVIPSLSSHVSNLLLTAQRAPIIIIIIIISIIIVINYYYYYYYYYYYHFPLNIAWNVILR